MTWSLIASWSSTRERSPTSSCVGYEPLASPRAIRSSSGFGSGCAPPACPRLHRLRWRGLKRGLSGDCSTGFDGCRAHRRRELADPGVSRRAKASGLSCRSLSRRGGIHGRTRTCDPRLGSREGPPAERDSSGTSPPAANDCAPDCAPKGSKRDPLALADDLLRAAETASDPAPLIAAARALVLSQRPWMHRSVFAWLSVEDSPASARTRSR